MKNKTAILIFIILFIFSFLVLKKTYDNQLDSVRDEFYNRGREDATKEFWAYLNNQFDYYGYLELPAKMGKENITIKFFPEK